MIATSEAKARATSLTAAELDIEREDGHRTLTHDGTETTHTRHRTQLSLSGTQSRWWGSRSLVTSH